MNKIYLIIIVALAISCNSSPVEKTVQVGIGNVSIYSTELEECEYWIGVKMMTHKGNCKNPIHKK